MIAAGPAHAAALAAIHAAAFPPGERWDARAYATLLATPGARGWLDPRGGLMLGRAAADEAEILTIGVAPGVRRQGLARGLLAAALADLAGRTVFLEVSRANAGAAALYAQAGFAPAGQRPAYYPDGSDALILRRLATVV